MPSFYTEIPTASGSITKSGVTYTYDEAIQFGMDRLSTVKTTKGFIAYDTSSIPDGAIILSAVLHLRTGTIQKSGGLGSLAGRVYSGPDVYVDPITDDVPGTYSAIFPHYHDVTDWLSNTTYNIEVTLADISETGESQFGLTPLTSMGGEAWMCPIDAGRTSLEVTWQVLGHPPVVQGFVSLVRDGAADLARPGIGTADLKREGSDAVGAFRSGITSMVRAGSLAIDESRSGATRIARETSISAAGLRNAVGSLDLDRSRSGSVDLDRTESGELEGP